MSFHLDVQKIQARQLGVGWHCGKPQTPCWLSITRIKVKCWLEYLPVTTSTSRCPRNGSVPQVWFYVSPRQCRFAGSALCVCERALGWGETCSVPHSSGQPLELLGAGRVHRRAEARHHLYTRTWHDSIINHVPCQTFFCKTNHFTSLTCVQFFLTVLSNDKSALNILYCLYMSFILQH